jgi:hypothetical protein
MSDGRPEFKAHDRFEACMSFVRLTGNGFTTAMVRLKPDATNGFETV